LRNSSIEWRRSARWFAAELLVVVCGVLIALALGSVYENRQDREREANYMRQLIADLKETERLMDQSDSINARWDTSIASLLKSYRGGGTPPRDSVLRWMGDVQMDNPVPVLGTADALVRTGDLQLIEDLDLRSTLISYVSSVREYNTPWLLSVEDDFIAARTLLRDRVDILEASATAGGAVVPAPSSALYDVGDTNPYPLDVARLIRDRDAYFLLVRIVDAKRAFLLVRDSFRNEARTLREQLEQTIEKRED
jgi:hypothetical protein